MTDSQHVTSHEYTAAIAATDSTEQHTAGGLIQNVNIDVPAQNTADCHYDTVNATTRLRRSNINTDRPIELNNVNDTNEQNTPGNIVVNEPNLNPLDYENDITFGPIWSYLTSGELTGDQKTDYKTMLMAPLYVIENEKLFRLTLPRSKKRSVDGETVKCIVIPNKFENIVLTELHEKTGHPAGQRLFDLARLLFYMPKLYESCFQIAQICTLCQETKINRQRQVPPLVSTPQYGPGRVFLIDFKVLPRKTAQGHTCILAMIDSFSGFAYFEPLEDSTSLSTAKAIIRRLLPENPAMSGFISDKGSAFISGTMKCLNKLLNCTHFHSASLHAQSHGAVERCIQSLNQLIALYATDDTQIADCLPLAELSHRISVQKPHGYSAFEIARGYIPRLNLTGNVLDDEPIKSHPEYMSWLRDRLKIIHADVSRNLTLAREREKAEFDKRNRVATPDWKVGDIVYLERCAPKPRSDRVLTHHKFGQGKHYITKIVERQSSHQPTEDNPFPALHETSIGPAYQLTTASGKILKNLVPSKRLKRFYDRTEFDKKHPPLARESTCVNQDDMDPQTPGMSPNQGKNDEPDCPPWESAKHIIRKRQVGKNLEFLIKFQDNSAHWCTDDNTSLELKRRYFVKQAALRRKRQRTARAAFKDD